MSGDELELKKGTREGKPHIYSSNDLVSDRDSDLSGKRKTQRLNSPLPVTNPQSSRIDSSM